MSIELNSLRGVSSPLSSPLTSPLTSLLSGGVKLSNPGQQSGFGQALESAVSAVETSSNQAHQAVSKFLTGDSIDIHSVAIASQRAEVSMELFQQVRNKLVSAYQEVMRSQM